MWTIPSLSYKSAGPFEKASWKALKFKQEKGIICEKFPIHDGLSSSIRCLMVSMNKIEKIDQGATLQDTIENYISL